MKLPKFGYCAVTADFLHIGHINFLISCSNQCEKLIVGIMSDQIVLKYKNKAPIMNQSDRRKIISCLEFVYETKIQDTFEFPESIIQLRNHHEDDFVIFDSEQHARKGADILIPYTEGISSTLFKQEIHKQVQQEYDKFN